MSRNGKGSRQRGTSRVERKAFDSGYDEIDWPSKRVKKPRGASRKTSTTSRTKEGRDQAPPAQ